MSIFFLSGFGNCQITSVESDATVAQEKMMDCHKKDTSKQSSNSEHENCQDMECCCVALNEIDLNPLGQPYSITFAKYSYFFDNKSLQDYHDYIFRPPIV